MRKMMTPVFKSMSPEKKQAMMLGMMPMMMQDVNMAETMLKMFPAMLDQISLMDLLNVLKKLFPHLLKGVTTLGEFFARWDELVPQMLDKAPHLMERIMPFMHVMMPMMAAKIMPGMMTEENKDRMGPGMKTMCSKMLEQKPLQKTMPDMMARMMPHCLETMLPFMDEKQKEHFKQQMTNILNQNTQKE